MFIHAHSHTHALTVRQSRSVAFVLQCFVYSSGVRILLDVDQHKWFYWWVYLFLLKEEEKKPIEERQNKYLTKKLAADLANSKNKNEIKFHAVRYVSIDQYNLIMQKQQQQEEV